MSATPPGSVPGYGTSADEPAAEVTAAGPADPGRAPDPGAAPQYQPPTYQPPPGFPAPYQAPPAYPAQPPQQYEQPQYQPPQQYEQPQYQAPQQYEQPQYQAPQQYEQPQYQPPQQYEQPQYQAPQQYQPGFDPAASPSAPPYVATGSNPYEAQPPGQYPGQARHSSGPADPNAYLQTYGSNPSAPGQPYAVGPGMAAPPNYAVYLTPTRRSFGVIGAVISVIGAALVIVSFTALDWISGEDAFGGTDKLTFSDLHDLVDGSGTPAISRYYFGWLGWALLAVVAVLAVLGNLATNTHMVWRIVGILAGAGAAAVTFFALYNDGTTLSQLTKYGAIGFWLAIGGFAVMGIGAVIGPRRVSG